MISQKFTYKCECRFDYMYKLMEDFVENVHKDRAEL